MAIGPKHRVPPRRKREGKTDYRKRMKLLLSRKPRFVVRISLRHAITQLVGFRPEGDYTIAAANSKELSKHGWKGSTSSIEAAYLTGLLLGVRAKKKKHKEGVLDMGFVAPIKGGKVFGALKGAIDAGMEIPHSEEVLPEAAAFETPELKKVKEKILKSGG